MPNNRQFNSKSEPEFRPLPGETHSDTQARKANLEKIIDTAWDKTNKKAKARYGEDFDAKELK